MTPFRNRTLVFAYLTGCDACAEAASAVDQFEAKHHDVTVVRVNLAERDWPVDHPLWASLRLGDPDHIPAYVVVAPDGQIRTHQTRGALTLKALEAWVYVAQA